MHDLSHDGRGVARNADGKTVFIDGALPDELVRYVLSSRRKQFDEGGTVEVLEASPQRVEPNCPHFEICAACSLQHLNHSSQLEHKHNVLVQAVARIGSLEPERWREPVAADPWHYRRKARLSVRDVPGKGRVLVGFRERNGRYVADMRECHAVRKELGFALESLSELIGKLSISGEIPQIEYAGGDDGSIIVIRHLEPFTEQDRSELAAYQDASNLTLALQSAGPDSIVGLDGQPLPELFYHVDEGAIRFAFRPTDFVQVNAAINELVLSRVLEALDLRGDERVLDLFCGLGNLTLPMARRAAGVVGVEGEETLVARARDNAAANGIENATFFAADLSEDHANAEWAQAKYDAVVIDPPRSGALEILPLLATLDAATLVYVSCNPGTLARDLGHLVNDHGFTLREAGVFDMFPHTAHVESMAVLTR